MATRWRVDEGLAVFIAQWKKEHPGAIVYTIGDEHHSATSDHSPEKAGPKPGQTKGEVDAGDFMPGKGGVTMWMLRDLRDNLIEAKDPRFLYAIIDDEIVSSVVSPWKIRKYKGKKHAHLHVSVNDDFENNRAPWDIDGKDYVFKMETLNGDVPQLRVGDEDMNGKVQYIARAQSILNGVFGASLDIDGVYGPKTAAAIKQAMRNDSARSTSNGTRIQLPEWRRILGVW